MSSVSTATTPKSIKNKAQPPKKVEIDKNQKYFIEFSDLKQLDQENIIKLLQQNNAKFDKNISQRVFETVIQLKNFNNQDLTNISQELKIPKIPPEISPEKLEQHKNQKYKKKIQVKKNIFGEDVKEENVTDRLTKSTTTSKRWKLKGFDKIQISHEKEVQKKKLEKIINNFPSSPDSDCNSHKENHGGLNSSQHKRTVSFKMHEDQNNNNNYITFNGNDQPFEVYETFNQLRQSIILKQQNQLPRQSFNQNCLENQAINNNSKLEQQHQVLKSSLKLQKVPYPTDQKETKKMKVQYNIIDNQSSKDEVFRKVEDSFCDENNIFEQKLQESFLIMNPDKQAVNTSITLTQNDQNLPQFHQQSNRKISFNLNSSDDESENIQPKTNIPKKIVKNAKNNLNESFILKVQKDKENKQKNLNKKITETNLKNIQSKVQSYIKASLSPKRTYNQNKSTNNIQDLKNNFLENLRSNKGATNSKPIPKSQDKTKNQLNMSLNNISMNSPNLRTSINSKETGSDSRYNSIERSMKLSKVLDPASQKQFEILQKYNQNFKIKSGLQFHKYCLAGQENKVEMKNKDNKNLSKSQILQKYSEKQKNDLQKPNIYDWELNDDEISELDHNEEITPKNFNKLAQKYHKWWFDLEDSQKMHFFSSEELIKYYSEVKKITQKSLIFYLKSKKNKRQN
ncbi:hypothetical protein TTHERM_00196290 (macronuclear) [Tetrahymena thermophila SB210]|uniref:Uncharacterized protein n=1 Tax=Tetrahymena thermophila (strain SB210) TaxID=312017 RepID=Q23K05_TETTS|nr:hypothetical protein TTHERM_00196290 [Tetrahymena thermophila SB210]EAR97038.2 hypothetical protein TTHERM_00196290 [Tetrahymena thermophila SB210]|eukprot:XP_001017283.2 hypothetical protein TTHERM_00196290 [Tetrahymena thermophila SB210]